MPTITGKIKHIYAKEKISEKLQKQDFVVDYTEEHHRAKTQPIKFEIADRGTINGIFEKINMLDGFNVGDEVEVNFNINGRQWDGPYGTKYFNILDCWKCKLVTNKKNERL